SPTVVRELERHDVEVIQVDFSESHKFAIAGLHCATLELVRDQPDAKRNMKPRIFLGSSGQQEKLLQALTRGLQDIADVDPGATVFTPGASTLERLVELTREVDFAAFVFAQDDWTTRGASQDATSGQASPRDNVVFEAGLFGGALGIRRTFILHADG